MMLDPKDLNLPWTTESDLPYGEQPRIYDATGALVAVVGNAETEKQDDWERNASAIVSAVNALSSLTPADVGGLVERLNQLVAAKGIWGPEEKLMADAATALEAQAAELSSLRMIADSQVVSHRDFNTVRAEKSEAALAAERAAHAETKRERDEAQSEIGKVIKQGFERCALISAHRDEALKAMELAEFMMTKDSLCEAERLEEGLLVVRRAARRVREGGKS